MRCKIWPKLLGRCTRWNSNWSSSFGTPQFVLQRTSNDTSPRGRSTPVFRSHRVRCAWFLVVLAHYCVRLSFEKNCIQILIATVPRGRILSFLYLTIFGRHESISEAKCSYHILKVFPSNVSHLGRPTTASQIGHTFDCSSCHRFFLNSWEVCLDPWGFISN